MTREELENTSNKSELPLIKKSQPFTPSKTVSKPLWKKLVIGGVFLVVLGLFFLVITAPLAYPENISVSNVSSESITLSWTTDVPMPTKVVLLEAGVFQYLPFFYYASFEDDRDLASEVDPKRSVHYVTLEDLKPNTRYVARIYSGVRQVHEQKLTTGPVLAVPNPNLVYGKVLNPDQTGAAGVLVYLRLINERGNYSALMSTLTDSKGSWSIEVSNARVRNLQKGFGAADLKSELLVVDDGRGNRFKATTPAGKDKPWPNVVLQASGSGGAEE